MTRVKRVKSVEFLVCLAIILVLFSLITSACLSVTRKANESACLISISQLSRALMMYCDDNDECMPLYAINIGPPWTISTRSYAAKANDRGSCVPPYICRARADKGYGYGLNIWVAGKALIGDYTFSDIILLADGDQVTDDEWWIMDAQAKVDKIKVRPILKCHNNHANIAFLDGSIKRADPDKFNNTNWYFGN